MKKHKCECPKTGSVEKYNEYMYSEEEKSGMNHEPNECKGTNEVKQYERGSRKLWLCSCCYLFGDLPVKNKI